MRDVTIELLETFSPERKASSRLSTRQIIREAISAGIPQTSLSEDPPRTNKLPQRPPQSPLNIKTEDSETSSNESSDSEIYDPAQFWPWVKKKSDEPLRKSIDSSIRVYSDTLSEDSNSSAAILVKGGDITDANVGGSQDQTNDKPSESEDLVNSTNLVASGCRTQKANEPE
ncbi:hypothetical protein ABW19_dt0207513 [Dactylella cylindrospora]|nr:hypothetical protein ABW19_dt0207513 [Dactylella cylindrospora]